MTVSGSNHDPLISVIVPHYNDLSSLDLCLASLKAQAADTPSLEIIVCDNNSPLELDDIVSTIAGRARLVIERQKGAGPARNRAVSEARGQILAFIDSDCVATPDWIKCGVAALARADLVGGKVEVYSNSRTPTASDLFEQAFAFQQRDYVEKKGFSVTANLFCRHATFDAVGPFVNGVSEDLEWCHRARRKGYSITYASDAVVQHPSRENWDALVKKWDRITRETYTLMRREGASNVRWSLRQLAVVASIAPHSLRVLRSELRAGQKLAVLGVLARIRLWRAGKGISLIFSDRA